MQLSRFANAAAAPRLDLSHTLDLAQLIGKGLPCRSQM
jgi:hypothetical protein